MSTLFKVRLRLVATADFRYGIPHHVDELRKAGRMKLGEGEVALLISQTKLQLAFVLRETKFDAGPRRGEVRGLTHLRVQLDRHCPFNSLMLQNYAESAGLEIEDIKRFEAYMRSEVRELAREAA